MKKRPLFFIPATVLLSLLFLLPRCSGIPHGEEPQVLAPVESVTILPTEVAPTGEPGRTEEEATRLDHGARAVSTVIAEYFASLPRSHVLSEDQREGFLGGLAGSRIDAARAVGRQMGDHAVLLTILHRYDERQGRTYSVARPASIDLEFRLVEVGSGDVLWSARLDETQASLFSNMLDFFSSARRGFQWVQVEELAREGIPRKLDSCPYIQDWRREGGS